MVKQTSGIDNIQKARKDILELMPTEYSAYIMTQLAGDFVFDLNEKIKGLNAASKRMSDILLKHKGHLTVGDLKFILGEDHE